MRGCADFSCMPCLKIVSNTIHYNVAFSACDKSGRRDAAYFQPVQMRGCVDLILSCGLVAQISGVLQLLLQCKYILVRCYFVACLLYLTVFYDREYPYRLCERYVRGFAVAMHGLARARRVRPSLHSLQPDGRCHLLWSCYCITICLLGISSLILYDFRPVLCLAP